MFTDINAFIFDMDGTIIDSMGVWKAIDIEYLESLDIPFPEDLQPSIEGKCFRDVAVYFKKRFKIEDSIEDIEKIWNDMAEYKYTHEVKVKEGVIDLLSYAKEKSIKTGIATSNSRRLTEIVLKANGLYDYFDLILTGCDTLKSKPDPDIYLTAAKGLKVNPANCLVFEDIIPGILAGKNAGMKVCGVHDLYSEYCESEKKSLSDYYINSYKDIKFNK